MTSSHLLERFHDSTAATPALMREVMNASWLVPTNSDSTAPALFTAGDGQHRLLLFSTRHAVQEAGLEHETLMKLRGAPLLSRLHRDVDEVVVDAGSPRAVHWKKSQLTGLRRWARVALMEELLPQVAKVREDPHRLREFPSWVVLMADDHLVLAPHTEGRRLAAVFTSEDAAEALVSELSMPVTHQEMAGRDLFPWLSRMALDGIAFNCRGPAGKVCWNHSLIARLGKD